MIFGTKKNEVTGECGRLQNKDVMGRICDTYRGRKGAYKVLVGGPEGKRPFGRPRHKWEDNIKMGLQELNESMDMIDLAQYRGQVAGS